MLGILTENPSPLQVSSRDRIRIVFSHFLKFDEGAEFLHFVQTNFVNDECE